MSNSPQIQKLASPLFAPKLSWLTRVRANIFFLIAKPIIFVALFFRRLRAGHGNVNNPDYIKSYPAYPSLKHRFFIPKKSKSPQVQPKNTSSTRNNDETPKYPLYIDIHGGGFAFFNPSVDDIHNRPFCDDYGVLVISLDYPKSPAHVFPVAVNALTEIVIAILSDDTLPIDKSRVAIGGGSAGANLALGIVQDERLQGRIHGVQARYPPVDFAKDEAPIYQSFKDRGMTMAGKVLPEKSVARLRAAYMKEGQDLKDPRLSIRYADKRTLPKKILTVGCEWDLLCPEEENWMRELAGGDVSGNRWEKGGLKWICVEGEDHAFDHGLGKTDKKIREQRASDLRKEIAEWMFREIYA